MSEPRYDGPLDVARDLQAEALRLDALAQVHLERRPDDLQPLTDTVRRASSSHPWIGQEVSFYGIALTVSIDSDLAVPYCLPPKLEKSTMRGEYQGTTIRYLYDPEADEQKHKVVHVVHTGTTGPVLDPFGDQHTTDHFTYMCVQDSEGEPVLPCDAHSLRDLADDPVVAEIDEAVLGEDSDPLTQIAMLGERVNEALADEEFESQIAGLNHQRVSYLNSLGLHDCVQLTVNDLMIGDGDPDASDFLFSTMESAVALRPYFFAIALGYDRLTGHDVPLTGGPPELYAQSGTEDGQVVLAPLKSVLDVTEVAD